MVNTVLFSQQLPTSTLDESVGIPKAQQTKNQTSLALQKIYEQIYFYNSAGDEEYSTFLNLVSTNLSKKNRPLALKIATLTPALLYSDKNGRSLLELATTTHAKELLTDAGHAPEVLFKKGFKDVAVERALKVRSKNELFDLLVQTIQDEDFPLFYALLSKLEGMYSNAFGTTIRAYAMTKEDPSYLEACDRFGITDFFSCTTMTPEARKGVALTFLGSQGVTYVGKKNFTRSDYFNFEQDLYPIFHALFQGFVIECAHREETLKEQLLLSPKQLEEVGDAIIMAPFTPSSKLAERIKNNQPTLIHTGSNDHSITVAFNGKYLFINNRGAAYKSQTATSQVYVYSKNNISAENIQKLREAQGHNAGIAGAYIYNEFLEALGCKPAVKLQKLIDTHVIQSKQKFDDCVVTSLKTGLRMLFLSFHADKLTPDIMSEHYTFYKSMCKMIKQEIPHLLELDERGSSL